MSILLISGAKNFLYLISDGRILCAEGYNTHKKESRDMQCGFFFKSPNGFAGAAIYRLLCIPVIHL